MVKIRDAPERARYYTNDSLTWYYLRIIYAFTTNTTGLCVLNVVKPSFALANNT